MSDNVLWDDGSPDEEVEQVETPEGEIEEIPQEGDEEKEEQPLEDEIDYSKIDYSKIDMEKVLSNNPNLRFSQKVNGKEENVELSWEKMTQDYQKWSGANAKFDETNKLKTEIDTAKSNFKTNPREMFEKAGIDPEQWMSDEIDRMANINSMTPDQKKAYELQNKVDAFEAEKKKIQDKEEDALIEKFAEQKAIALKEEIPAAMEKLGLPQTEATVQAIAKVKYEASRYEDTFLSVEDAALIVKDNMNEFYKAHLNELSPEQLSNFLGEKQEKAYRNHSVAKFNKTNSGKKAPGKKDYTFEKEKEEEKSKVSFEDIFG